MKEFLNKKGLIISLSLVLLIIFVFGGVYSRFMTNQIEVHEIERYESSLIALVDDGDKLQAFEAEGANKTYVAPGTEEEYTPNLIESYKVLDNSGDEIAVIYILETKGKYEGVKTAYAISLENNELLTIKVIENNETPSYFERLNDRFYRQFIDKDLDVIDFSIDAVSGATYSSLAFETGMKYARELYAVDFNFEIVNVILEINSLAYNYDLNTMNTYQFVAEITFDEDDKTAVIHLDNDFNYLATASGDEVTQAVKDALPVFIPDADLINTDVKIQGYDETSKEVTISVSGYSSSGVTMNVVLNANLDGVEEVNYVSSNESYYEQDSESVENGFINNFNANGTVDSIDSYGGATITARAMSRAIEWIQAFEVALNGGS